MHMKRGRPSVRMRGFSLVEVLVSIIVISIGLLGVAKIQALALSSTGTARMRSMAAFAAASLAATMHADRAYWASLTADPAVAINVASATVTAADANLVTAPAGGCTTVSPCKITAQLAAQDLRDWLSSLKTTLPASANPTATINCQMPTGNPVTCAVHILWREHLVSTIYSTNTLSSQQQAVQAAQNIEPTSYTLYVEP
jgi:type IV pilus assembly protein PilV